MSNCSICGEPMAAGEEVFKFHGYSGPCPKPPQPNGAARVAGMKHAPAINLIEQLRDEYIGEHCQSYPDGHYVSTPAQNEYIGYLEDIIQLLRTDAKANP
jgi:hypothetical protein